MEELFSENAEGSHKYNACLNTMATRISTVFASMRVCCIPYQSLHCLNLVISVYIFVASVIYELKRSFYCNDIDEVKEANKGKNVALLYKLVLIHFSLHFNRMHCSMPFRSSPVCTTVLPRQLMPRR